MIKELQYIFATILLVVVIFASTTMYTNHEKRKAYYACLQVVEKVVQEQNKLNGGIRIVSLPFCSH
jgi:hypothetical protein